MCGTTLVAEEMFSKAVVGRGSHVVTLDDIEVLRFSLDLSREQNTRSIRVFELERDHEVRIIAFERADGSSASIPTGDSVLYNGDTVLAAVRQDLIGAFSKFILD